MLANLPLIVATSKSELWSNDSNLVFILLPVMERVIICLAKNGPSQFQYQRVNYFRKKGHLHLYSEPHFESSKKVVA